VTPAQAGELVLHQVQLLQGMAQDLGTEVQHVKLHGALYNMVSRDRALAESVVKALGVTDRQPVLYVLAGSELERVARGNGDLVVVNEVFADRSNRPGALITDEAAAEAQVLRLVREGRVRATDGSDVLIQADTICLHGDGPTPVAYASRLRAALAAAGIEIKRPGG
jgi:UPF0271 protein